MSPSINRARALAHLPGPSIGLRFSFVKPPREITALCLATPRGLCRVTRRPPDSGAGIDSGCGSLEFGFAAADPSAFRDFLFRGQPLAAVFRSATENLVSDENRPYWRD